MNKSTLKKKTYNKENLERKGLLLCQFRFISYAGILRNYSAKLCIINCKN